MAIVRVFLFLIFITIIVSLFVKYIILGLYKILFIEKKYFNKIVKKEQKKLTKKTI